MSYNKLTLSTTERENLESSYYRVEDFGFTVLTTAEQHGAWVYPTPADVNPAGWFNLTIWPVATADVNGDGLDDLVVRPMMYPHVVPRATEIQPLVFIQGSTGFEINPTAISDASNFPAKYHLNQIGVGDFNRDGYEDLAFGSEGEHRFDNGLYTISQTPLVVFGGAGSQLPWSDQPGGISASDYGASHIMSVGDFNGDSFDDWVSGWYAFYSDGSGQFEPHRLVGIGNNAATSADVNGDGFDDLIYSSMPSTGDTTQNGGDLKIMLGSLGGLKDGAQVLDIYRSRATEDNVATSSIADGDFNGDGHVDLLLAEHGWVTDAGDSTTYYAQSYLRFFAGDGSGGFVERPESIVDPYAKTRKGGANLFSIDVNGDSWVDAVMVGGERGGTSWNSSFLWDATSIFLNDRGVMRLVDTAKLAFVEPYQISGYESSKQWNERGVPKSYPIDLGNDGLVDFVGFVETPLRSVPQNEQLYTYAYVSRAIKPLGRDGLDEFLTGTLGNDRIFGYDGNDVIGPLSGDDDVDGGSGYDIAVIDSSFADVSAFEFTSDGRGVVLTSSAGRDTLVTVELIRLSDREVTPYDLRALFTPTQSFSVVREGVATSVKPVFFTGLDSLNLHYQLVETTPNAIVVGSALNDFIALQGGGNKAADASSGDDVVDGGVGSTFVTGGAGSNTFFLDGRASGVSWSTITDFKLGTDKATIWGWKAGVSRLASIETNGGAEGFAGLTLHFENLLPDGAANGATNRDLNSITMSGRSLADFGAGSLAELNSQIAAGSNPHFLVGQTTDAYGDHGFLHIS